MRTKMSNEQYFDFSGESSLKIVNEYRTKYGAISDLLDANGQLLTRALIVMFRAKAKGHNVKSKAAMWNRSVLPSGFTM